MAQKNGADNTQPPNAEKPSLEKRISAFEDRQTERQSRATKAQMPVEGMAMAGRVAAELVAGLVVGGAVFFRGNWRHDECLAHCHRQRDGCWLF